MPRQFWLHVKTCRNNFSYMRKFTVFRYKEMTRVYINFLKEVDLFHLFSISVFIFTTHITQNLNHCYAKQFKQFLLLKNSKILRHFTKTSHRLFAKGQWLLVGVCETIMCECMDYLLVSVTKSNHRCVYRIPVYILSANNYFSFLSI